MNTRNGLRHPLRMIVLAAALLPLTVMAQAARLKMPDFSGLAAKAKESVDIDLDHDMLKNAMGFMSGANVDPQLAEQLKGLESVSVKVFSFDKPGAYSMKDIEGVVKQVETQGWKKLMSVRGEDERVEMWMRDGGANPADGGMFFVTSGATELVLINIAGKIDLATLSKLQGKMGVPNLGLGNIVPPAPPATPAPSAGAAAPAPPAPPAR